MHNPDAGPSLLYLQAGEDAYGEQHGLGMSNIEFKVIPQNGLDLFVLENVFHQHGGPAKHLHYDQDEWFYVLEGNFVIEVGTDSFKLGPGDSLLAPRNVPHVWAFVGETKGRILVTFAPAGKMVAFFQGVTKANAMPPQDPALWQAHGMQLLGPPLKVKQKSVT